MKIQKNPFLVAAFASGLLVPTNHAAVAPYSSADADTSYLYHFNEASGASVAANIGSTTRSAISVDGNPYIGDDLDQPVITTVLGATGYSGFGNAANVTADACLGVDADGNGGFRAGDAAPAGLDQMTDHSTIFGTANAFTLEALINVPSITIGTREIICTDSNAGAAADRGFQFRITPTGNLEFNFIGSTPAAFIAAIPTTGTHAFVANQWFHVALTYDGTTLTYYWTKVDPAVTSANAIATNAVETVDVNDDAILVLGNEGRATGGLGGESLAGLLDEVRISKVARSASQFIFSPSLSDSDGDELLDDWEVLNFRANESETVAEILLKQGKTGNPDGDAFDNFAEQNGGSDPNNALSVPGDVDGDGLTDSWEITHFASITAQDGAGDPDTDFATNEEEETAGTIPSNPNGHTSFPDSEPPSGDGLSDAWEMAYFSSLAEIASGDPDLDLFTNAEEYTAGTDPTNQLSAPDSDADGLNDGWEAQYFFVSGDTRAVVLAKQNGTGDADSDGYTNEQEETALTNPITAEKPSDLDADGLIDSWELAYFGDLTPNAGDLTGDADSATNLQEQNAGSDPLSTASTPTDIDGDGIVDTAEVFQPYTADSNTLHLWHLNEVDQPATDAGTSALALTALNANGQMWASSFGGFGTGLNPSAGRGTLTGGVLSAKPLANDTTDDTTLTYAGAGGAFTFEGIVRIDFDPAVAPAAVNPMQIVTGESDVAANRVWQFRLVPVGAAGNTTGTAPLLEFINLTGEVAVQPLSVALPTGGDPDAIAQGNWYHVAVAYNGSEGTPNNLKFYWTLLDPSRTSANEIFSGQMTNDLIAGTPDFTIGNEGRDTGSGVGSTDSFLGVIDEVRISSIARSATGFLFIGADTDNLDDAWETTYFEDLDETDTGDFDHDGTDNLTEFRLGLIPNSGSSRFAATGGANGSIQWPSVSGVTFKIERSGNLSAWTTLQAAYAGTAGTASYTDPSPLPGKGFYKVTLNP